MGFCPKLCLAVLSLCVTSARLCEFSLHRVMIFNPDKPASSVFPLIKLSFCEVLVNFFYRPPCNVSSNSIWVFIAGVEEASVLFCEQFLCVKLKTQFAFTGHYSGNVRENTKGVFLFIVPSLTCIFFFCGGQTQRKRHKEICKYCWFFTAECSSNGMNSEYAVYWLSQHFLLFS